MNKKNKQKKQKKQKKQPGEVEAPGKRKTNKSNLIIADSGAKIKLNTDNAVNFCAQFHPKQITLTAITLKEKPRTYTKTFHPEQKAQIEKFLSTYEGSNFYFSVNPTKTFVTKKANKSDIASVDWLHVDIDLDYEKDNEGNYIHLSESEKDNQLKEMLKKANEFVLPPSYIIFSGGGYQLLWKLKEPIIIRDKEHWEELELFNRQLIILLKGDPPCFNIDRIMRLPGTTNYPTKIKLKKGRVPIEAKLIEDNDLTYSLRDFEKAAPGAKFKESKKIKANRKRLPNTDIKSLSLKKNVKDLLLKGKNTKEYESRSEAIFYCVCEFVRLNFSPEKITSILSSPQLSNDFREHLNKDGSPVRAVERLIERAHDEAIQEQSRNYEIDVDGGMVWMRFHQGIMVPVRLSNFSAEIITDIQRDDGAEVVRQFGIKAKLHSREFHFTVRAKDFSGLNWVLPELGAKANLYPGHSLKDHTRSAIQALSSNIESQRVFGHFGWRKINDKWIYIHAGGGIDRHGFVFDLHVDSGNKRLLDYTLPEPGPDLKKAILTSLAILDIADDKITIPSFAAIYRAPLGEIIPNDFSLFFVGQTGVGKSVITALMQAHFGQKFSYDNLPGSWSSTANSLEKQAFQIKDSIFTVDDFAPSGSTYDVQKIHKEAERLFRAQGNRSGRGRMNADGSARPVYYPRGIIVSSGEDIPRMQSIRARMMIIEISPDDINFSKLNYPQEASSKGLFSQSMTGYIQWLAPQMDKLKKELPRRKMELRTKAMELNLKHNKTPEMVSNLMMGIELFIKYAQSVGAMGEKEGLDLNERAWNVIVESGKMQAAHQRGEEPTAHFLNLIRSAFITGNAHAMMVDDISPPENAGFWGWQAADNGIQINDNGNTSGSSWKPRGEKIGWVEGENVYLDPESAYSMAQKMGRNQGNSIAISKNILWKRLKEKKLIISRVGKNTNRRAINGKQKSVLEINIEILLEDAEKPSDE